MSARHACVEVVEAAYRLSISHHEWMSGVAEAAHRALDRGLGTVAISFRVDAGLALQLDPEIATAGAVPDGALAIVQAMAGSLDSQQVRETWAHPLVLDTASAGWERSGRGPFSAWSGFDDSRALGVHDSLAAKMLDPSGAGFLLCALLPRQASVAPREEARWRRVMTHVLAGQRLRSALLRGDGDAVLHPDGRLAHTQGEARSRTARDALRAAARAIDRARTAAVDEDWALEAWRGLAAGRWSLVDRFDRDGRRFLVARRNDPSVASPPALSLRERQVLAYAALGHSNKHIAYALGLSPSTISTHLRGAMRKVGRAARGALPGNWHSRPAAEEGS